MRLCVLDNSEMERLFSLMNKIKGKFQYWMNHEVLRDCIWWNKSKKLMPAQQWNEAVGIRALHPRIPPGPAPGKPKSSGGKPKSSGGKPKSSGG